MAGKNSKKIFEPEDVEQLLQGWLFHSHKGRNRHDRAARRCDTRRVWIGGAATVLSAIVGTSIFVALQKQTTYAWVTVVVGLVAVLAAILTSLSAFLNLSERAEKHRSAGVGYKTIIRELERILSVSAAGMSNKDPVVMAVQTRLDQLEEHAPVVPERLNEQIDDEWLDQGIQLVPTAAELYLPPSKRR